MRATASAAANQTNGAKAMRKIIDEEVMKERIERRVDRIPVGDTRRVGNRTVHRCSAYLFEMKKPGERGRTALVLDEVVEEITGNGW